MLGLLLLSACTFGSPASGASSAPPKSAVVRWLQDLDESGASFSLTGRVSASGHVKNGEIAMSVNAVQLVVYDGVLYGLAPGAAKWLEMSAAQANFLWPAARLSLVWESILLAGAQHSPFALGRDQVDILAGALQAAHGEISIPPSLRRIEVRLDSSASVLEVTGRGAADIVPPASATPGNVVDLIAPGVAA